MANIDKKEENKKLKKQLKQALRKIEKLQSENESLKTSNKALSGTDPLCTCFHGGKGTAFL